MIIFTPGNNYGLWRARQDESTDGTSWRRNVSCKLLTFSNRIVGGSGAPGRIRTCGLRIRSPLLYPAELRAQLRNDLMMPFFSMTSANLQPESP